MKDWFKKNWLNLLGWVLVVVGSVILIYSGIKVDVISKGVVLVNGIIVAIGALIAFISGTFKKKE